MWTQLFSVLVCILTTTFNYEGAPQKRKAWEMLGSELHEKRITYEKRHYLSYSIDPEVYKEWPELYSMSSPDMDDLLRKIFVRKSLAGVTLRIVKVELKYEEMEKETNQVAAIVDVAALEFRIPNLFSKRKYIYFTRSTDPTCVFFLTPKGEQANTFYIAAEICEYGYYPHFWRSVNLQCDDYPSLGHIMLSSDPDDQQKEYELHHRQHYCSTPGLYETWPELQQKDMQTHCRSILRLFLPQTIIVLSHVKADHDRILLRYRRIEDDRNEEYRLKEVESLICCRLDKAEKNLYQFIRSPNDNCIYLVRKNRILSHVEHYITKHICDYEAETQNTVITAPGSEYHHHVGAENDAAKSEDNNKRESADLDAIYAALSPIENV